MEKNEISETSFHKKLFRVFHKLWAVSKKFFVLFLDFLFPREDESLLLSIITPEHFLSRVSKSDSPQALFDYKDPLVRALIWHIKYKGDHKVVELGSKLLHDALYEEVAERIQFGGGKKALLIPIPAHKKRIAKRGFNQTTLLLKGLLALENKLYELDESVVVRIKETGTQSSMKRRVDRLKATQGVFSLKNKAVLKGRVVIVIDDVLTTGATLAEMQKVLKEGKPGYILTLALAH